MRKYFATYNDTEGVEHHFDIYDPNYTGEPMQVTGYVEHEYLQVDDIFECIRASVLTIHLDADTNLTFEDLYTNIEQQISIEYFENSDIKFRGYINPDGIFQDWVSDRWELTLEASDGLGYLSDVAFFPEGTDLIIKEIDVIAQCLSKTGLFNEIFTNIPFNFINQPSNTDPLDQVYLRREVFIKDDYETLMSCEEALRTVLEKYAASIYQEDGRWVITTLAKINNGSNSCYVYNSSGVYNRMGSHTGATIVGSQIDDFYPHHCDANQRIELKPIINTIRVNTEYKEKYPLNPNANLINDGGLSMQGWTVYPGVADLISPGTVEISSINGASILAMKSNSTSTIAQDSVIELKVRSLDTAPDTFFTRLNTSFKVIATGSTQTYYLKKFKNDSDPIWTTSSNDSCLLNYEEANVFETFTFKSPPLPIDATISIEVYNISSSSSSRYGLLDFVSITIDDESNVTGKNYTLSRVPKVSSVANDTIELKVGSTPPKYMNAMIRSDNVTAANLWAFRGEIGYVPLEKLICEIMLVAKQYPQKVFSGNVYGRVRYPGIYQINNVTGRFIITNYKYNTLRNITEIEAIEMMDDFIADPGYSYKESFSINNETTNPTIEE